jgi:SAM-dependent methyltransferase
LLWTAQPNRFLVAEVGDRPPGAALDVGCGEGRNALWLATRGWQVTAVDHSAVGLEKGRQLAAAAGVAIEWVLADVTEYRPAITFDLVAVLYLHLPRAELEAVLAMAAAAVGPAGLLVVVGHHSDNIAAGTGGPQDPALLYGPDDVAGMIGELAIVKAETVTRPVEGAERPAIDTLVTATTA